MKRIPTILVVLLILAPAANIFGQQPYDCKGSPEVCTFFRQFVAAFNDRTWKQFSECFADDATGMFDAPWAPERKEGRKAVEAMFAPFFPAAGVALEKDRFVIKPEDLLVQDLGDAAVLTFHMRTPDSFARRVFVVRKKNKKWEIVHVNGSSFDLPAK